MYAAARLYRVVLQPYLKHAKDSRGGDVKIKANNIPKMGITIKA
ncbi:MAG: hypothetical protein PHQ56_08965 [Dysgonamonadaceae bacterium]|nr:hypothetical protein [Dysgonamonadaceae bacterium]